MTLLSDKFIHDMMRNSSLAQTPDHTDQVEEQSKLQYMLPSGRSHKYCPPHHCHGADNYMSAYNSDVRFKK